MFVSRLLKICNSYRVILSSLMPTLRCFCCIVDVSPKNDDVFLYMYLQYGSSFNFSKLLLCHHVTINAVFFLNMICHSHILFSRNTFDTCCPNGRKGRSEV